MNLALLPRYWHTVRQLKPVQVYARAWFRLWQPRPNTAPAPPLRATNAVWHGCARRPSLSGPMRLRLLGIEHDLTEPGDWDRADWPKLWRYNAHYFDDLVADDAPKRKAWQASMIERWVVENPPARGTGWEPYPLSLRIVNWIKWAASGNELTARARQSLAVQVRHLRRRLEFHLLGNHLWANAKALVFAGAAHQGGEASAWLKKGLMLIERELGEQILDDDGHFERSPMYHAIVLEDFLDLLQLAHAYAGDWATRERVARWRSAAGRMLHWLQVMSHPDGAIAHFNDAAFGIAPTFAALRAYAEAIGVACETTTLPALQALPRSGYVRLQRGPAVVIADVGDIGPDYLPGHAHADTLSFECSLHGQRLLVNAGTSTYEPGGLRSWQRSTAAHNTVVVDGRDSSEVWGSFRVARRAYPYAVDWQASSDTLTLDASHDGYLRLPGKVRHQRRWQLTATGLRITDRLEGRFQEAAARYRFAPDAAVEATRSASGTVRMAGTTLTWRATGVRAVKVVDECWYPGFGQRRPCQVLELALGDGDNVFELAWNP
jgi:uncharacterized heparinase superfamily protein